MWKVNTLPRTGPELNDKGFFLKTCEYPPGAITYEPGNDQNLFFFFLFFNYKIIKWEAALDRTNHSVSCRGSKVTSVNVTRGFLAALCISVCNDTIVHNKPLTVFCEEVEGNVPYDQM